MEKDDFSRDDFLGRLIQQTHLDSPSDDFVGRVMANLQVAPQMAREQKPFLLYLKAIAPFALLAFVFIVVFSTSDLPFLNWVPGKTYYLNTLVPYFGSLLAGLKNAFATKYVSFGMLIVASTGLLYLVDRLFSRRTSA